MAEFVEFRIEETIPEVEEMERLGILSNKEVKKLIQKRRDFEYRLARRSKKKIDFINYINYEKKLIELVRIRRKQMGVFEKKHQIEASIARRVLKQTRLLSRLWPSHLDTWALRIGFAHFVGWKAEITQAYTEQVNFHGNSESLWVSWAKWEIEERNNFDKARAILLSKAPLYHPKSQLIKRELFRLELLYVEKLLNKVKYENIAGLEEVIAENQEKVLNCAVARTVYLHTVNSLQEPELYLQLYQVADKFKFAHKLREEIYRDLCIKFPDAECLWKLNAQRLISGLGIAPTELLDNTNTTIDNNNSETVDESAKTKVTVGNASEGTNHTKKETKDKYIPNVKKIKDTKIGTKKDDSEESGEEEENSDDHKVKNDVEEEDSGVEDEEVEGEDEMEQDNSDVGEEDVMEEKESDVEEEDEEEEEEEEMEQKNDDAEEEDVTDEGEESDVEQEDEMEENSDVEDSIVKVENEEDDETEEKNSDEEEENCDNEEEEDDNWEDIEEENEERDSADGTQEDKHESDEEEEDEEVEGEEEMAQENSDGEEQDVTEEGEESDEEVEGEEEMEQENDDVGEEDAIEEDESDVEEEDEMEENSDVEESIENEEDDETEQKITDEEEEDNDNEEEEDKEEDNDNKEDEEDNSENIEEEQEEKGSDDGTQKKDKLESGKSSSKRKTNSKTSDVETIVKNVQKERAAKEVKQKSLNHNITQSTSSEKLDPKGKLELFLSIFDQAMEVVGAKFVTTYIDELLPLLHQCWGLPDMTSAIYKSLLKLFEQHKALLSPLHFYIWYLVLCEKSEDKHKAQAVLECGVRQHPAASHLQLELARCIIREADTDAQIMKELKKVGSSMQGECGLIAWKELAKHLCKDNNKLKLFKAAMDHEDQTVARGMRVLYLQDVGLQEGITGARKLYQKLKWRPPFCGRLQAQMVELELAQATVKAEAVREVFNISVQQQGSTNPGMWLAYIHFEKKYGEPLRAGGLLTRAEKELEAQQAHVFRELNLTIQELQKKEAAPLRSGHSNRFFIEKSEDEESQIKDEAESRPALASLFEEELILSYTANNARTTFFSAIRSMERNLKKDDQPVTVNNGREWEKILELLLGHKITLTIQEVKVEAVRTGKSDKSIQKKLITPRFKDKYKPTDRLNLGEEKSVKTVNDDDIEKILASSEVLKPDFMQKTCLTPYFVNKKKAKEMRKKESLKTKGPGWFNMKAPELTEEAKRDLEVLQMRSVLDPKRHYKNDMKVLPKYFQIAEVVDSPVDFYSSRVPKKKRKRTMAEEVLHDEEALRYQKKKYTEIMAARQKKQFKHPHVLRKKKTKNLSKKK